MKKIRKRFVAALIGALLLWALTGCADSGILCFTEEACQKAYAELTPEEIEAAKAGGELVSICDLTDCIFVWIE